MAREKCTKKKTAAIAFEAAFWKKKYFYLLNMCVCDLLLQPIMYVECEIKEREKKLIIIWKYILKLCGAKKNASKIEENQTKKERFSD